MDKQHQSTCGFISGKVFKPEWERIVPFMPAFKCLKIIDFSYKHDYCICDIFNGRSPTPSLLVYKQSESELKSNLRQKIIAK